MKRTTALTLLLSIALTYVPADVTAMTFADTQGTPYNNAYAYLSQEGIVQGYPDGTGRPYSTLNRAEALKVIVGSIPALNQRATYHSQHASSIPLFFDIRSSDWFSSYIEAAFEKQIVTGYPDGSFRPGNAVRVEEAIALLMRAHGESGTATQAQTSNRIENRSGEWFTPVINAAIQRNLIGQSDSLRLGTAISRGQFFEMVYRMHTIKKSGAVAFQDGSAPTLVSPSTTVAPVVSQATNINIQQPAGTTTNINAGQPAGANHQYASNKPFSITIPAANIYDLSVIHPSDPFTSDGVLAPLKQGVGHLFSYPGGGGKIMIYGHSSSYPWDTSEFTKIFRKVNELNTGDRIYVTYDRTMYVYEVTFEETIDAADTSRFNDNGTGESLILYTCWPPDSIAQRYLVHAVPVDTIQL